MSFVSYDEFMKKMTVEPGVVLSSVLRIGDIVDFDVVNEFVVDVPPISFKKDFVQAGEAYVYAKGSGNESRPCYLTFSKQDDEWIFRGVCFEDSVNQSNQFGYAIPSVGQYCMDRFNKEFIRAAERYFNDEKAGVNVSEMSVIDNYMDFNAFSMAGYLIVAHGTEALNVFKESWSQFETSLLYGPVVKLLENMDKSFDSIVMKGNKGQQKAAEARSIDDVLADASSRAGGSGDGVKGKADMEFDY